MHIGVNAALAAAVLGLMANPGQPSEIFDMERDMPAVRDRGTKGLATLTAAIPAGILAWCAPNWAVGDYKFQMGLGTFSRGVEDIKDYITSMGIMQGAVATDPKNYDAWTYWGLSEAGVGELINSEVFFTKAIDRFTEAHNLYPQNANVSANIGRTLWKLRKFNEAEIWFQRALEWGDGSRLIHWWYADLLFSMGRYREALDHYIPVFHKHSGWKRELIQDRINKCMERLKSPP